MNANVTSLEEYKKNRNNEVTEPSQNNYHTSEDILVAIGVIISILLPRSVYAVYADSGVASFAVFGSVVAGIALGLAAYWKWPFELVSMGLWVAPRVARRTDEVELRKAA